MEGLVSVGVSWCVILGGRLESKRENKGSLDPPLCKEATPAVLASAPYRGAGP